MTEGQPVEEEFDTTLPPQETNEGAEYKDDPSWVEPCQCATCKLARGETPE